MAGDSFRLLLAMVTPRIAALPRHSVSPELARIGFLDGDAFVVAAIIGRNNNGLVVGAPNGLQQKLTVSFVDVEVQVVVALLLNGGQLRVVLVTAHLELKHVVGAVHDHRRRLHGIHDH